MKVILAQPRGFCAGVVRAIEIVERALQKYGPPVYVRHEIVHNKHVVESLKAKGARFVEDLSEVPPHAVTIFSAHGVAKSVEEEAATARAAGAQRHLPAGHQGAQSGQALRGAGAPAHSHRPCRSSGGRRHDGADLGAGDAGADRARRRQPRHSARHAGRLCHADDAERRRHPRHHRRAAAQFHRHRRAGDARHLLRHAEPPDRGARTLEQAGRRHPGGRRQEQLELQPAARDRQRSRHSVLSDRRRQRGRAGMVRRRGDRRHHRRRFGAGSAGRRRDRRLAPAGPGRGLRIDRPAGDHRIPAAAGVRPKARHRRPSRGSTAKV